MHIRRRRALTTFLASFLLAGGVLGGVVVGMAAPASAANQVTIKLTSATQFCANVTNNVDRSGQPIQLWTCSGAGDAHFNFITGQTCVAGSNCYEFQDVHNSSLCITTTVGGAIQLGTCGGRGSWYDEGANHLGNGAYGASYTLAVVAPSGLRNGIDLTAQPNQGGGGDVWERWNY
jgi:hypothetical protein